jgi:type II secretory pathway pseudopilin PulG
MMNMKFSKQNGIGLLEVLIALLVVSLGLLGLAKFQGSLLNTSGSNKARAEAIGIAQQQLEIIRYAATDTVKFRGIPAPPVILPTIDGTNAIFTVDVDMDDPLTNDLINVIVDVSWTDATGVADNVTLMTEIALQDIQKSAFNTNDSAAAMAVPSPRQSASEDVKPASQNVNDPNVISPTATPLPARGTVIADGTRASGLAETFVVNSTDATPIPYTLTAIANDSRYYNSYFGDGNLAVYVCDSTSLGGCRYIQNHFGGVSLSTSGKIFSAKNTNNDLSNINPVWSSSEVTSCYQGPISRTGTGTSRVWTMPYECVYAGNCKDNVASCQQGVTVADVTTKGVGSGGEFGNLGLIGLDGSNGGDQVCYLEGTSDWNNSKNVLSGKYDSLPGGQKQYNESYLFPVTARSYVTRRLLSNGAERSEGINKSYRIHNFLLVNRTNNADQYKNCFEAVASSLLTYVLAPREIVRIRTDNPATNPVEATYIFSGTMPAITIKTTVAGAEPNIYLPEIGSCYVRSDNVNYACVVPSNFVSGTLYGGSSSVPTPITTDPVTPTPVSFRTCNLIIDTSPTQAGNISASSLALCAWSSGYP